MSQTPHSNGGTQYPPSADLVSSYTPASQAFDELMTPTGQVRPHWQSFVNQLTNLTAEDRVSAHDSAARKLSEDGVTYVSQDSADGSHAPWQLDLLPLIIPQAEWDELERGLVQRAHLLNALLKDIYGDQKLMRDGRIPPALVLGNPEFLRPCHGLKVPEDTYLHLLAFDLARSPNGKWWVLNDRTQAPTGLGFALENRSITSRSLPDLFNSHHVRRLTSFFQGFNENLLALTGKDEPVIGVLSSGPGMETYFEHAYLARYLGYSVVEGADLTVRDDRVYLKTVEGLKAVDLLLRRVDSANCDPLELNTGSYFGVPSLVKAARSGNVIIGNALGSGVLENDGFNGFIPALCRHVLGEEPVLPDVATWWCGQPAERQYVLDRLDKLIIRKAYLPTSILNPGRDAIYGPSLSSSEREELAGNILKSGHNYVGQEIVSLSTAPAWTDPHTIKSAPLTLRVFVARTKDGYKVMPGGLSRISDTESEYATVMRRGDYSKDTWVIADDAVETPTSSLVKKVDVSIRRSGKDLPSRTADNMFWLGRYIERAEGAVRLYRSLLNRLTGEFGTAEDPAALKQLVQLLVSQKHLSKKRAKDVVSAGVSGIERELWAILFDPECPDGLSTILSNVKRTAELVRERLSLDTWRILGQLCSAADHKSFRYGQELTDALLLLDEMIQYLSSFNGMVMENMTRRDGWRFLDMGRRLERAYRGVGLMSQLAVEGPSAQTDWLEILLDFADSTMTYRTRYKDVPVPARVLDLLLADESNPRSAVYQFEKLESHIDSLPDPDNSEGLSPAKKLALGLRTELMLIDVEILSELDAQGARADLAALLSRLETGLENLSNAVGRSFFIHAESRRVSGPRWSAAEL